MAHNKASDLNFDEIMKASPSEVVQAKYRMSMGMTSLGSLPKTADMSSRTSVSSSTTKRSGFDDFWDDAKVSTNSFTGNNISMASSDFAPAENLLLEDQGEDENEFAPIHKSNSDETNWQDRSSVKMPEMSFGQFFRGSSNIRDIYGNKSPPKRRDRVALVELSNQETPADQNRLGMSRLQEIISKLILSLKHQQSSQQ